MIFQLFYNLRTLVTEKTPVGQRNKEMMTKEISKQYIVVILISKHVSFFGIILEKSSPLRPPNPVSTKILFLSTAN